VALQSSFLRMFLTYRQRSTSPVSCSSACVPGNSLKLVLFSCLGEPLSHLRHLGRQDTHRLILSSMSRSHFLETDLIRDIEPCLNYCKTGQYNVWVKSKFVDDRNRAGLGVNMRQSSTNCYLGFSASSHVHPPNHDQPGIDGSVTRSGIRERLMTLIGAPLATFSKSCTAISQAFLLQHE
jgi:hypothetical protein